MAEVTSKPAVWPSPTAPTSDTTGPSIGGCVAEVIVRSFHPQLLIRWMRPPVTLLALVVVATFRRRWAALARWLPTPLTCTRRKVRRSPPRADGTDGPASTCSCVAVPKFFVGADASTDVSASTFPTTLLAVHGGTAPTQAPSVHVSPTVQASPPSSSHGRLFGTCTQPSEWSHSSVVHEFPSSQSSSVPPTQSPSTHVSSEVQALPSSQGPALELPPLHSPAPSQVMASTHCFAAHGAPADSNPQVGEQQSPDSVLWSSQSSNGSCTPLPQVTTFRPLSVNWSVNAAGSSSGSPGPSIMKKFVPQELPVTLWSAPGLPVSPGPGGTGPSRKVRHGPPPPGATAPSKPSAGWPPAAVRSMAPAASACSTFTPWGCVTAYTAKGMSGEMRIRMRVKTT